MASLEGDNSQVLASIQELVAGSVVGVAAVKRLAEVLDGAIAAGVAPDRIKMNPSIARGLDYYTGLVLETTLDDLPDIGSVASGGRYDDLAGLYTSQALPGIGASLGVDRLLAAMEKLGLVGEARTPADALVVFFAEDRLGDYPKLAASLRAAGVGAELYPEPKKLAAQLKYADKKGFRLAIIAGPDELSRNECQIKSLATGESTTVSLTDAPAAALKLLEALS
jgi:histidyl-tRNA synthetase